MCFLHRDWGLTQVSARYGILASGVPCSRYTGTRWFQEELWLKTKESCLKQYNNSNYNILTLWSLYWFMTPPYFFSLVMLFFLPCLPVSLLFTNTYHRCVVWKACMFSRICLNFQILHSHRNCSSFFMLLPRSEICLSLCNLMFVSVDRTRAYCLVFYYGKLTDESSSSWKTEFMFYSSWCLHMSIRVFYMVVFNICLLN